MRAIICLTKKGYLFGHDIVLPLVFSLLNTRDAKDRTFGLFAGVVRDRLGYDYPEETLAFLKEKEQPASDPLVNPSRRKRVSSAACVTC